jgi:hypothetical protein
MHRPAVERLIRLGFSDAVRPESAPHSEAKREWQSDG